jgi:xanthine dehydrogenase YagS FAD-binding subunit
MRNFAHVNATSLDQATEMLRRYGKRAAIVAGGTDLLGKMKDEILHAYPEALINIKSIPGLDGVASQEEGLTIGTLTTLADVATNGTINELYPALAEAAARTASTHLREMGTIGGNISQDIRCWYYRNPNNRFPCLRKGGGRCYAIEGDNRYHSIFGGSVEKGCYAVHPSDIAPALVALDATIKTTKRSLRIEDFFQILPVRTTALDFDEIVTEIILPPPIGKSAFMKFALRKAIDFPIVNCAAAIATSGDRVTSARICLNAVYVKPYRAFKAEKVIIGKAIREADAEAAGAACVVDAQPMTHNAYMVPVAKTMIKRAILGCA